MGNPRCEIAERILPIHFDPVKWEVDRKRGERNLRGLWRQKKSLGVHRRSACTNENESRWPRTVLAGVMGSNDEELQACAVTVGAIIFFFRYGARPVPACSSTCYLDLQSIELVTLPFKCRGIVRHKLQFPYRPGEEG